MKTTSLKPAEVDKKWIVIDAEGLVVAMSMEGWCSAGLDATDEDDSGLVVMSNSLGAQAWHADGPHLFAAAADGGRLPLLPPHALTVFVPLVDVLATWPRTRVSAAHDRIL